MRCAKPLLVVSVSCGLAFMVSAARAGTMVEDLIAQQNPCRDLKADVMGTRIGIDKVKSVKVNHANLTLNGNNLKMDLSGSLACETGPGSAMVGDASADLKASASASLANCKVSAVSVALSNFGGSLRDLLAALQPSLQESLKQEIKKNFEDGCKDFRAGAGAKSAMK